jgi:hypothetical protein
VGGFSPEGPEGDEAAAEAEPASAGTDGEQQQQLVNQLEHKALQRPAATPPPPPAGPWSKAAAPRMGGPAPPY